MTIYCRQSTVVSKNGFKKSGEKNTFHPKVQGFSTNCHRLLLTFGFKIFID